MKHALTYRQQAENLVSRHHQPRDGVAKPHEGHDHASQAHQNAQQQHTEVRQAPQRAQALERGEAGQRKHAQMQGVITVLLLPEAGML